MVRWGAVLLLLFVTACGDGTPSSGSAVTDPYSALLADTCETLDLAGDGDVKGAERVFENRVHGPLHDLAAEVEDVDRDVTADLLVAKNDVEEALKSLEEGGLTNRLRSLGDAVSRSIASLGGRDVGCSDGAAV